MGSAKKSLDSQNEKRETAKQLRELLKEKQIKCKVLLQRGHIGRSIVDEASRRHADIIIIGRRSLGTLDRKLASSTSSFVAHHANCCVFVVKEESSPHKQEESHPIEPL